MKLMGEFQIMNKKRIMVVTAALLFLLYYMDIIEYEIFSVSNSDHLTTQYIVNTEGCKIPYLNMYDRSILKYLSDSIDPLVCSNISPLIYSTIDSLVVNRSVLEHYGKTSSIQCSYRPFWRIDPKGEESDHEIKYGERHSFTTKAKVRDEFVEVECKIGQKSSYRDFHSFAPKKNTRFTTKRTIKDDDKLNIIVLGLDTMSRLHFHRKMPLTVKYLLEEMKSVEFLGYNKVSDNTFPNLIPMLTGYAWEELIKVCWPSYATKFDNCSFVWENYTKAGYITNFSEDKTAWGLFNYLKKGFFKQPTDYYWKTFSYLVENEIGHFQDLTRTYPQCVGPRPMFNVLWDYVIKFIETMKHDRFFSFFWCTSLAHENVNAAALGDKSFLKLLSNLNDSGILNRSILLVLSDHGIRFGNIATTHQGHLEDRLPFLYVNLPSWFKDKYQTAFHNLEQNALKLTTPFDVFGTLNHLLRVNELTTEFLQSVKVPKERGISLFLPIPPERDCESAGIPSHWCTCQRSSPVNKTDYLVVKATQFVVKYMNSLLKDYGNCSVLELTEITSARLAKAGSEYPLSDYSIGIRTSPGNGLFEATVRCLHCTNSDFNLISTISRLNRYGNQSHCINDFNLKLYCYCV